MDSQELDMHMAADELTTSQTAQTPMHRLRAAATAGLTIGIKWGCALLVLAVVATIILVGIGDLQRTRQGAAMGADAWQFINQQMQAQKAAQAQQTSGPGVPIEKILPPGATATVEDVKPPAPKLPSTPAPAQK